MVERLNGYAESIDISKTMMGELEEELKEIGEEALSEGQEAAVRHILIEGIAKGWYRCLENAEKVMGVEVE